MLTLKEFISKYNLFPEIERVNIDMTVRDKNGEPYHIHDNIDVWDSYFKVNVILKDGRYEELIVRTTQIDDIIGYSRARDILLPKLVKYDRMTDVVVSKLRHVIDKKKEIMDAYNNQTLNLDFDTFNQIFSDRLNKKTINNLEVNINEIYNMMVVCLNIREKKHDIKLFKQFNDAKFETFKSAIQDNNDETNWILINKLNDHEMDLNNSINGITLKSMIITSNNDVLKEYVYKYNICVHHNDIDI